MPDFAGSQYSDCRSVAATRTGAPRLSRSRPAPVIPAVFVVRCQRIAFQSPTGKHPLDHLPDPLRVSPCARLRRGPRHRCSQQCTQPHREAADSNPPPPADTSQPDNHDHEDPPPSHRAAPPADAPARHKQPPADPALPNAAEPTNQQPPPEPRAVCQTHHAQADSPFLLLSA